MNFDGGQIIYQPKSGLIFIHQLIGSSFSPNIQGLPQKMPRFQAPATQAPKN